MGLLDKVLRERKAGHPEAGTGLFAKALISLDRAEPAARPECEGRASPALPKPEAYPYGVEELAALEAEIQNFGEGSDSLLLVFQRISEALPLEGLALFTACDGAFRPAIVLGFKVAGSARIEESLLKKLLKDPVSFDKAARGFLSSPESSETCRLRAERSEGSVGPLWVYGDERLDASSPELCAAVSELFRSIPQGGPFPATTYSANQLPSLLGEGHTTAFSFGPTDISAADASALPGLTSYGKAAALRSAAELVLGNEGRAVLSGDASVLVLLHSNQKTDEELALFQLRKSLARALPSVRGCELPKGRALGIDSHGSAAEESLERFASR